MNRSLPPGDCGNRSAAARRTSRHPRTLSGSVGLVGGTEAPATVGHRSRTRGPRWRARRRVDLSGKASVTRAGWELSAEAEKPATAMPGGPGGRQAMLPVDAVGALAVLGLEGFDGVSGLLHRARHEPANGMLLPSHLGHDLSECGALLALQHRDNLGRLAALARPGASLRRCRCFGLGRLRPGGRGGRVCRPGARRRAPLR
jgi:hypothetical protein